MKNLRIEKKLIHFLRTNNIQNNSLYWYPLVRIKNFIPAAAYDICGIYKDNNILLLENIVKSCSIEWVTMFQMDTVQCFDSENIIQLLYEQDEDGYVFQWYSETFLFDQSETWLIYLSHERTISFTGKEIVTMAKKTIPSSYLISIH